MPAPWPEATLNRLYLIVGGTIVAILFAALVVPWFVNWNDYRPDFESQASRILGHPVHVLGWARASILPSLVRASSAETATSLRDSRPSAD